MATPAPDRVPLAPTETRIAVVHDADESVRRLREALSRQGYDVRNFENANDALAALEAETFDVLLTDLAISGPNGLALWSLALEHDPHLMVILISDESALASAVEATTQGVFGCVRKPVSPQSLAPILKHALDARRLQLENLDLREMLAAYELSQVAAQTLDPGTILNRIADAAVAQWRADEVSIMVPGSDFRSGVGRRYPDNPRCHSAHEYLRHPPSGPSLRRCARCWREAVPPLWRPV